MSKLGDLLEAEGYDDQEEYIQDIMDDSINSGICMNPGCSYVSFSVEPDCVDGYCEECGTNTVKSATELILF
jgi:hypothetical protein